MSISRRSILASVAATAAAAVAKSAPGQSHPEGHAHHTGHGAQAAPAPAPTAAPAVQPGVDPVAYARYTSDMHADMQKMMTDMHADPPSGDPDIDFLVMMIPHHQGAVDMARLVLRDGRDPLVRGIAEKIIAGQLAEIEGMRGRLAMMRKGEAAYPSLDGNRG